MRSYISDTCPNLADVPDELRTKLEPNEQVLWHGQPCQGLVWRVSDWFLFPFSLAWGIFFIHWTVSVFTAPGLFQTDHIVFLIFGLLFSAIGVYGSVGRFWADAVRRRNTWYAVTSSRVLIAQRWPMQKVTTLDRARLAAARLDEGFSDVGTIRFPGGGDELMFYLMGGNESWPWAAAVAPPSFERIHDARHVYELIRTGLSVAQAGV